MKDYGGSDLSDWTEFEDVWRSVTKKVVPARVKVKDPIEDATDDALILELIKRGYAVGKLNDDNRLEAR